jgi:hypothetical protein
LQNTGIFQNLGVRPVAVLSHSLYQVKPVLIVAILADTGNGLVNTRLGYAAAGNLRAVLKSLP